MWDESTSGNAAKGRLGAFLPLLLLALAFVASLAFQGWQLWSERSQLADLRAAQGAGIDTATKLRASLETLASGTAKLADAGNRNAAGIVNELRARGVTIDPAKAAASK